MPLDLHSTLAEVAHLQVKMGDLRRRASEGSHSAVIESARVLQRARYLQKTLPLAKDAFDTTARRARHQLAGNERAVALCNQRLARLERTHQRFVPPASTSNGVEGIFDSVVKFGSGIVNTATNVVNTVTQTASNVATAVTTAVTPKPSASPDAWETWCDANAKRDYGGDLVICKRGARGKGIEVGFTPPWTIAGKQARFLLKWGIPNPNEYDPEKLWVTMQTDMVRGAYLFAFATAVTMPIGMVGAPAVAAFMPSPANIYGVAALANIVLPLTAARAIVERESFLGRVWRVLLKPVFGDMLNQLNALFTGGFTTESVWRFYLQKEIDRTNPTHSPEVKWLLGFIRDNIALFVPESAKSIAPADLQKPQGSLFPPPPAHHQKPTATSVSSPTATQQSKITGQPQKKSTGAVVGTAVAAGAAGAVVGGPIGAAIGAAAGAVFAAVAGKK